MRYSEWSKDFRKKMPEKLPLIHGEFPGSSDGGLEKTMQEDVMMKTTLGVSCSLRRGDKSSQPSLQEILLVAIHMLWIPNP